MLNLLWHEIRSRRGAFIGWSIGLILYDLMYIAIYPEMQEQLEGLADLSVYQAMGIEMASFEGYIGSTVIGLIPVLLGVYVVMAATATLAGEEEDGTLELLLTTRLKRWQIVTAKTLALLILTGVIVVVAGVGNVLGFNMIVDQINTTLEAGDVFAVMMSTLPLIWALMMISLFMGTFMPNRRLAMMMGFLVLLGSYFGENIGGMVDSLEGVKPFSLFSYFDSSSAVFVDGVAAGDVAVLLVISVIAFALALVSFQRRDVTVGLWPWQWARKAN